jgi:hemerythrin-like domain-containing protein
MAESYQPNVAKDLARIHSVITRALRVAAERSQAFAQQGYPDASTREGFASYVRSLVSVLDGHHLLEDELAFPYLRDKLPEAPYDLLMAQHREMLPILEQIKATIEAAAEVSASGALNDINRALTQIAGIWHPHIQIEEEHFTPEKTGLLIDAEEHLRLSRMFGEYSQQHTSPDYLVVPFILYNLPAEQRAIQAQAMPPIVTQQLVPIAWKEKWASMVPFLLD